MEHVLRGGGPITGLVMTVAGIAMQVHDWVVGMFVAAPQAVVGQAAPGWTLDSVSQALPPLLTILGALITFFSLQRSAIRKANREDRVEEALADIRIEMERQKAAAELKHIEVSAHLARQDVALDEIKQVAAVPAVPVSAASGTTNNVVPTILALAPPPETKPSS